MALGPRKPGSSSSAKRPCDRPHARSESGSLLHCFGVAFLSAALILAQDFIGALLPGAGDLAISLDTVREAIVSFFQLGAYSAGLVRQPGLSQVARQCQALARDGRADAKVGSRDRPLGRQLVRAIAALLPRLERASAALLRKRCRASDAWPRSSSPRRFRFRCGGILATRPQDAYLPSSASLRTNVELPA